MHSTSPCIDDVFNVSSWNSVWQTLFAIQLWEFFGLESVLAWEQKQPLINENIRWVLISAVFANYEPLLNPKIPENNEIYDAFNKFDLITLDQNAFVWNDIPAIHLLVFLIHLPYSNWKLKKCKQFSNKWIVEFRTNDTNIYLYSMCFLCESVLYWLTNAALTKSIARAYGAK